VKTEVAEGPTLITGADHGTEPRLAFELLESKFHPYSAYRKLGASSRSEAVTRIHELGLDAF